MKPVDQSTAAELASIENTLVVLLRRITSDDRKLKGGDYRRYSINELLEKSHLQSDTEALVRQPIRNACANAVRLLGERLIEMNVDRMEVHHRVVRRGRRNANDWSAIIDKTWDGTGDWHA